MKLAGQGRDARRLGYAIGRALAELRPARQIDLATVDPVIVVEAKAQLDALAAELAELRAAVQQRLAEATNTLARRLGGGGVT